MREDFAKLDINDSDYPAELKEIAFPPSRLFVRGRIPAGPRIAIVGTRRATENGKKIAKQIASDLSARGIVVVSGLATGIDEAAHQGALAKGRTIAVLPTGLDKIYPAQNDGLAKTIVSRGGALITEYAPNTPSYPFNFVQRNRIISGISLAVVVIEAPEKSGALITARYALEQNREVMAIPGPANHPNYSGSHQLLREGAALITSAKEVLEELGLEYREQPAEPANSPENTSEEKAVLEAVKTLGWPVSVDKISKLTHIEVPKVNQLITFLTLRGLI